MERLGDEEGEDQTDEADEFLALRVPLLLAALVHYPVAGRPRHRGRRVPRAGAAAPVALGPPRQGPRPARPGRRLVTRARDGGGPHRRDLCRGADDPVAGRVPRLPGPGLGRAVPRRLRAAPRDDRRERRLRADLPAPPRGGERGEGALDPRGVRRLARAGHAGGVGRRRRRPRRAGGRGALVARPAAPTRRRALGHAATPPGATSSTGRSKAARPALPEATCEALLASGPADGARRDVTDGGVLALVERLGVYLRALHEALTAIGDRGLEVRGAGRRLDAWRRAHANSVVAVLARLGRRVGLEPALRVGHPGRQRLARRRVPGRLPRARRRGPRACHRGPGRRRSDAKSDRDSPSCARTVDARGSGGASSAGHGHGSRAADERLQAGRRVRGRLSCLLERHRCPLAARAAAPT